MKRFMTFVVASMLSVGTIAYEGKVYEGMDAKKKAIDMVLSKGVVNKTNSVEVGGWVVNDEHAFGASGRVEIVKGWDAKSSIATNGDDVAAHVGIVFSW